MNLCPQGHDKDVVGTTDRSRCKECKREMNRRRWRAKSAEYRKSKRHAPTAFSTNGHRLVGIEPLRALLKQRIAVLNAENVNKHGLARGTQILAWQHAERFGRTPESAAHQLGDMVSARHKRVREETADEWCITLGTHLSIVYPEAYHPAAVIEA